MFGEFEATRNRNRKAEFPEGARGLTDPVFTSGSADGVLVATVLDDNGRPLETIDLSSASQWPAGQNHPKCRAIHALDLARLDIVTTDAKESRFRRWLV